MAISGRKHCALLFIRYIRARGSILTLGESMGQLEEMRVFVEIARAESITGAAHRLEMAPSAVSRRLKDLENRLGVQLLTRTTRQVNLTEIGRTFLAHSNRILEEVAEAENEVVSQNDRLTGTMRVTAPISWGLQTLPQMVANFMKQHEDLKIEIDLSDGFVDLVESGIDIAVRIGELPDSSLIARRLADIGMHAVVSPDFQSQHGPIESPKDLEKLPGLLYQGSSKPDVWSWEKIAKPSDGSEKKKLSGRVSMPMRMKSNNGDMLAEAAACGLGVVLLPDFLCREKMDAGKLVPILTDYRWGNFSVFAVYPPTRHLATRTRTFIDYLAENLK